VTEREPAAGTVLSAFDGATNFERAMGGFNLGDIQSAARDLVNGISFQNYYPDVDGDGFGSDTASAESSCAPVAGKVTNNADCNDANINIRPGVAEALGISLMSGLWGGLFGLAVLVLCTESLAQVALAFTPAAYFSLGILGLSVIAGLSGGSLLKGVIAAGIGLSIAFIGSDPVSGVPRFTATAATI